MEKKQRWTFIQVVIVICILGMFIFAGSKHRNRDERRRRLQQQNTPDVHPAFYPFDSASLSHRKDSTQE